MSQEREQAPWCKYSKRVALRTIMLRSEGWRDLEGERMVVGGWIKCCKAMSKRSSQQPFLGNRFSSVASTDVTCTEMIVNRLPFLRPLARLLAPQNSEGKQVVTLLRINDGSVLTGSDRPRNSYWRSAYSGGFHSGRRSFEAAGRRERRHTAHSRESSPRRTFRPRKIPLRKAEVVPASIKATPTFQSQNNDGS